MIEIHSQFIPIKPKISLESAMFPIIKINLIHIN